MKDLQIAKVSQAILLAVFLARGVSLAKFRSRLYSQTLLAVLRIFGGLSIAMVLRVAGFPTQNTNITRNVSRVLLDSFRSTGSFNFRQFHPFLPIQMGCPMWHRPFSNRHVTLWPWQVPVTVASLILSQVCDGAMLAARESAAQRWRL